MSLFVFFWGLVFSCYFSMIGCFFLGLLLCNVCLFLGRSYYRFLGFFGCFFLLSSVCYGKIPVFCIVGLGFFVRVGVYGWICGIIFLCVLKVVLCELMLLSIEVCVFLIFGFGREFFLAGVVVGFWFSSLLSSIFLIVEIYSIQNKKKANCRK